MADAEAAAAEIIRAAYAQSKQAREARTKLADAWRQLPDGGWQRDGPRKDSPIVEDDRRAPFLVTRNHSRERVSLGHPGQCPRQLPRGSWQGARPRSDSTDPKEAGVMP